jgi:hypothetical protein
MTLRAHFVFAMLAVVGAGCHRQPVYRLEPVCPPPRDSFRVAVRPRELPVITGRVTNLDTGAPVSDAVVTISPNDRRQVTDSVGLFALDSLPPGQYVISIRRIGYVQRTDSIALSGSSAVEVRIPLEPSYVERCPTVERVPVR